MGFHGESLLLINRNTISRARLSGGEVGGEHDGWELRMYAYDGLASVDRSDGYSEGITRRINDYSIQLLMYKNHII